MKETLAERLTAYATALQYRDLPSDVVQHAKRVIIDTLGCAIGAYTSEPSKIAREVAASFGPGLLRGSAVPKGMP